MAKVSPYLTVDGGQAAIDWYCALFGCPKPEPMMAEDGKRVMHATLMIYGEPVMLSDSFPEYGGHPPPDPDRESPVAIGVSLDAPAEVDDLYEQALAAGATNSHAPEDMFWGDRFAQFIDPFGHRWMLTAALTEA